MSARTRRRTGFSLLEVIIATAILAASAMLLLSLFSTGERHSKRAGTRVLGQMLCQSTLDELLADPSLIRNVADEPVPGFDGWTYSVDWTPTDVDGLVALHVSVSEVQKLDRLQNPPALTAPKAFELIRWTRFESPYRLDSDRGSGSTPAVLQP